MVLEDAAGNILLVRTCDPDLPSLAPWWELPGGGLRAGEDLRSAAVREVAEEAGIDLSSVPVRLLAWQRTARYVRHGELVVQREAVVHAVLREVRPATSRAALTAQEEREVLEVRWWPRALVESGADEFWPRSLPDVLGPALAGQRVVESVDDRLPVRA